ncbi:MAG: sensor domain-containing diguanylate cyclase [Desulfomonilia bacterium]|jgi:diguanylate cyclase (GGDEF)-like protein/PAS domain S-box-containing protein
MDVDITRLEAILSPYIVLIKDSGVEYVSDGLAKKLGVISEQLKKNLEDIPELFTTVQHMPSTVLLTSANDEANKFIGTTIPLDGCRVIAFCEEPLKPQPIMEYADRDTFVRMFNRAYMGCLVVDKGVVVYTNDFLSSLLGLHREQVLGNKVIDFISKESRPEFVRACQKWYEPDFAQDAVYEIMLTSASGTRLHFMAKGGWIGRGSRQLLWIILHDITQYLKIKRTLKEEQQKYHELFERSSTGMLFINPRGKIIECNDYVAAVMGYTKEQINGSPFTKFVMQDQAEALKEDFRKLFIEDSEIKKRECVINTSSGQAVHIEYNAQVIFRKGHPIKAFMMFTDVTDKKALEFELLEKNAEMERTLWDMAEVKDALEARAGELNKASEDLKSLNEKLGQLSITDGLTEVYNHRHFQDRLSEEVERLNRQKDGILSLLMLDIDDFKRFNDTYGHQCGDMVLKQLAMLLKNSIRAIDILARYGGEEFAIILPNSNTEQAVIAAERICQNVRSTPFSFGSGTTVKVTVSIGVGTITSAQADKSELVRKADSAMYAAKAKWKDRVEIWEED